MNAELVFVGTELLLGEILNTNAQYLSQQLSLLGVDVYHQQVVGDNAARLRAVLTQALGRADLVIACGGLGPTDDDITREVAAEVAGRALKLDEGLLRGLEAWFATRGRKMTENNRRQCMVPEGAKVLPNDRGTAPGLIIPAPGGKEIVLLPGPPGELQPMFARHVVPYLTARNGGRPMRLVTRTLRFVGIGESALADGLKDLLAGQTDPTIAPYAKTAEVHLRLATRAADQAEGLARIAPVEAEIRARFGRFLYGTDDEDLAAAVGRLLADRGLTLATAESCTGGLVAKRITDVAGSSAYFRMGFVTYASEAKERFLGVPADLIAAHGVVSEPVALAMAQGALERAGADVAVAITGVAGPGGGTPETPVGTVCFGLAARGGAEDGRGAGALPGGAWTERLWLHGDREGVRERAAVHALAMVRRYLTGQLG
ncbi:nicotinamide-nucleotide amidase [Symbiobacterium terraclitae]|uniref:Putative competence-damage inducible protein n=1 Tax=Symbiobacterium terraclitae TaxID=557451 RepID=A0ABS4JMX2_9FIRM|nr:nicotinamide-nucleotide amidase [Symbiobacterium terraclitae]